MKVMTVEDIRDYTALAVQYFKLSSIHGDNWRPEYADEMAKIKKKIEDIQEEFSDFFASGR